MIQTDSTPTANHSAPRQTPLTPSNRVVEARRVFDEIVERTIRHHATITEILEDIKVLHASVLGFLSKTEEEMRQLELEVNSSGASLPPHFMELAASYGEWNEMFACADDLLEVLEYFFDTVRNSSRQLLEAL